MKRISLLLLPGLDGTGKLFDPFVRNLPAWIKPLVVSYPPDKPYGYQELRLIVSRSLPTDGDFVILGESFSGPLAVMAAAEKPKGLCGLILCASFVKKPFKFIPSWIRLFSVGPIYQLWPASIRLRAMLKGEKYSGLVQNALDAIKSVGTNVIAERVKAIMSVDVEQDFVRVDVPIIYLASRKDHLIKKHNVAGMKTLKPNLTVAEIDTQHFVLQLEPKKSAVEIVSFIERISSPSNQAQVLT
jgi:pimeloyl-[acyl-carrier protein] methyl ester esterase